MFDLLGRGSGFVFCGSGARARITALVGTLVELVTST